MKLITPQEARELSLSGHKIKCQPTREAETKFIEFLNKRQMPHGNLSERIASIEQHFANFIDLFITVSVTKKITNRVIAVIASFDFTDEMFFFFLVE